MRAFVCVCRGGFFGVERGERGEGGRERERKRKRERKRERLLRVWFQLLWMMLKRIILQTSSRPQKFAIPFLFTRSVCLSVCLLCDFLRGRGS